MKTMIDIYWRLGMLLVALWPVTLAVILSGLALMGWAIWQNRKHRRARRLLVLCLAVQFLAPVVAMVIQRLTWRPYGDNFSVDPREAVIVMAMLMLMAVAFVTSMTVEMKQRAANQPSQPIAGKPGSG